MGNKRNGTHSPVKKPVDCFSRTIQRCGSIGETQEVIDYCTARNIKADIELVRPNQINDAFARVGKQEMTFSI